MMLPGLTESNTNDVYVMEQCCLVHLTKKSCRSIHEGARMGTQ